MTPDILKNNSQLWKLKDPNNLVAALSQIINALKDLQIPASQYGIE